MSSKIFRWTTSDYAVTQAIIIAIVLAGAIVQIGVPVWRWVVGDPLQTTVGGGPSDTELPSTMAQAEAGVTASWDGVAVLEVGHPSTGMRLADLLPSLVATLAIAAIGLLVYRLIKAARSGVPFTAQSVRSLRIVAGVTLLTGLLAPVARSFGESFLVAVALDEQFVPGLQFDLIWFAAAGLAASLAEVFRRGAALEDDVEGLV